MVTAANGAEEFYDLKNNPARHEVILIKYYLLILDSLTSQKSWFKNLRMLDGTWWIKTCNK